ncbi:hypothetical protein ACIGBL_05040 [Streptomyces sp. NPDC085614]|uniref:hypothetical protein n=1 Tax=Streptomyces sp. NPDC085614 TaxID=3365733 RepID=UPI0037CF330F
MTGNEPAITYIRGDATAPQGAGGTWARVEPLVIARLVARGIPVTVYDVDARTGPGS